MRFIKLFEYFKEDIADFCDDNLAYFLDDEKYSIDIRREHSHTIRDRARSTFTPYYKGQRPSRNFIAKSKKEDQEIIVRENKRHTTLVITKGEWKSIYIRWDDTYEKKWKDLTFDWNSVKDSLIPFIQLLDNTYSVREISFIDSEKNVRGINKNNIENIPFDIKEIYITIRN